MPKRLVRRYTRPALLLMFVLLSVGGFERRQVGHAAAAFEVRIIRDEYGVPHIYADTLGALFFGFP